MYASRGIDQPFPQHFITAQRWRCDVSTAFQPITVSSSAQLMNKPSLVLSQSPMIVQFQQMLSVHWMCAEVFQLVRYLWSLTCYSHGLVSLDDSVQHSLAFPEAFWLVQAAGCSSHNQGRHVHIGELGNCLERHFGRDGKMWTNNSVGQSPL